MAEIVGIDRSAIDRENPARDERIHELLSNLMAMNDRGELRSLCYAYGTHDGMAGSNWSYCPGPVSAPTLVGAIEVLKFEMIEGMLKHKRSPDPEAPVSG